MDEFEGCVGCGFADCRCYSVGSCQGCGWSSPGLCTCEGGPKYPDAVEPGGALHLKMPTFADIDEFPNVSKLIQSGQVSKSIFAKESSFGVTPTPGSVPFEMTEPRLSRSSSPEIIALGIAAIADLEAIGR